MKEASERQAARILRAGFIGAITVLLSTSVTAFTAGATSYRAQRPILLEANTEGHPCR